MAQIFCCRSSSKDYIQLQKSIIAASARASHKFLCREKYLQVALCGQATLHYSTTREVGKGLLNRTWSPPTNMGLKNAGTLRVDAP